MIDDDLTVLRPERRALEDPAPGYPARPHPHVPAGPRHVVVADAADAAVWSVGDGLYVGRAPTAPAEAPATGRGLVVVASPTGSVSATHVHLRSRRGRVLARDLWSRNGTTVVPVRGAPFRLGPGEELPLTDGTRLDLGDGVLVTVLPAEAPDVA